MKYKIIALILSVLFFRYGQLHSLAILNVDFISLKKLLNSPTCEHHLSMDENRLLRNPGQIADNLDTGLEVGNDFTATRIGSIISFVSAPTQKEYFFNVINSSENSREVPLSSIWVCLDGNNSKNWDCTNAVNYLKAKANYCLANGKKNIAISHYQTALSIDPTSFDITFQLAGLLSTTGNITESINLYKDASKLAAINEQKWLSLARMYRFSNEWEKAKQAYLAVLKDNPRNEDALIGVALSLTALENFTELEEWLEYSIIQLPKNDPIWERLLRLHLNNNDRVTASQIACRWLASTSNYSYVKEQLLEISELVYECK